jgi:hypothetical protein
MIIALLMMLVGLLASITASQLYGLRLGGVIIVPLVAVYLLRSFGTFPIFILSTVSAYISVRFVKTRIPLYGRQLFIFSIIVGSLVPIITVELLNLELGLTDNIADVEFIGSVLPGIAAYNFHRLNIEKRTNDAVLSLAVLLFLVLFGIALAITIGRTPLADALPPLLLGPESDMAATLGITVNRGSLPVLTSNRFVLFVAALGIFLSESIRTRYGLRLTGVIALPIIVFISFRNAVLLPVWVVATALAYVAIKTIHWWTLIYGRALLAFAVIAGLLATAGVIPTLPIQHGLLPFFSGILAGVAAYNVHKMASAERPATVAVSVAVFVILLFTARLAVVPPPRGVLTTVTVLYLRIGGALLLPGLLMLARLEYIRPPASTVTLTNKMRQQSRNEE